VPGLKRLVHEISVALLDRPASTAAHRAARSAIHHAVAACMAAEPTHPAATGRPRLDRAAMIRRAMAAIEASQVLPTAAELAHQVGVNDRTLLRAFHERYGVPPKRYLMLRELHLIRRALTHGAPGDGTVADVLTRHGIWEFGRFAGRYRRHFGELPSATLRRARS
jgi:AraC family ethanolamine operon transcriptional activator